MSRATQDTARPCGRFVYGALTLCGPAFQPAPLHPQCATAQSYNPGDASTTPVWAVPASLATTKGIIVIFFSCRYLDVSVPCVRPPQQGGVTGLSPDGLPHSETCGSKVICTLPQLIAAYRVLHRLREPRHPPCALSYFLVSLSSLLPCAAQAVAHKGQGRRGHFKSCICHTMSKIVLALKKTSRGEYRTRTETDATRHRRRKLSP